VNFLLLLQEDYYRTKRVMQHTYLRKTTTDKNISLLAVGDNTKLIFIAPTATRKEAVELQILNKQTHTIKISHITAQQTIISTANKFLG
jgi:hypothetical protein